MAPTPRDELYEGVAIDATGVMTDSDGNPIELPASGKRDVALHIEADESASFAVEPGVRADDGTTRWFSDDARTYDSTVAVHDQWSHPEQLLRVTVTTAAGTAGSTADVYVAMV